MPFPALPIDHVAMTVANFEASKAFYLAALAPLQFGVVMEFDDQGTQVCGIGPGKKPVLWLSEGPALSDSSHKSSFHISFGSPDREKVDECYAAAIAAGGKDNGGPGIRAHYHPSYYAAFVRDPDGNNVEVCNNIPDCPSKEAVAQ
eukprot:SM000177S03184  [mRNA]  locus=s177:154039:154853:+ [translate_table: standard]